MIIRQQEPSPEEAARQLKARFTATPGPSHHRKKNVHSRRGRAVIVTQIDVRQRLGEGLDHRKMISILVDALGWKIVPLQKNGTHRQQ